MPKSSKEWLRRHVTDSYVRKAKEQGYRSRAAFKLLEIDSKEKILAPGTLVVDLGAANLEALFPPRAYVLWIAALGLAVLSRAVYDISRERREF